MLRPGGTAKGLVLVIVGTMLALLAIGIATWFVKRDIDARVEQGRQDVQKNMRAQEAEFIKQSVPLLGKGGVFVSGRRLLTDGTGETPTVFSNQSAEKAQVVSIPWSVSRADFEKLAEGMNPEQVRAILDLSALHYVPNGPDGTLKLVCEHANRKVSLVFAGSPDVTLVTKSAEGAD